MAEPYLERLSKLVSLLRPPWAGEVTLEARHFFSGAALYANGKICASLSPAGLAIKVPAETRRRLIRQGEGVAFRFFPQGPIKREYVALSDEIVQDEKALGELVVLSVNYVLGPS